MRMGGQQVLRPSTEALYDTTPEALQPPLEALRDSVTARLRKAEEEAGGRLDDLLARITKKQVVKVRHQLNGREFMSMADVDAALNVFQKPFSEVILNG